MACSSFCLESSIEKPREGSRQLFTAFDALLTAISILIMLVGFKRLRASWRMGQEEIRHGDWRGLLSYMLGQKRILKNRSAGVAHLFLFWGVIIPMAIIIIAQFGVTMPQVVSRLVSLLMDMLGVAFLIGILFFLIRRGQSNDPRTPKRKVLPILVLLFILITGFLAEATRLSIAGTGFSWAAPVGWLFSLALPESPLFMQLMIRFHFFAVLLFIALLPFTFMRHLATGALNVFYRKHGPRGTLRFMPLEKDPIGARSIGDLTWKQLLDAEACVSCGRCEENCPAAISGKPLSPRKVIQDISGLLERTNRKLTETESDPYPILEEAISSDEIWSCSTCMACAEHCPVFIEPLDKIIDMRRYRVLGCGDIPAEARPMIRNLELYGDVQGKGIAYRGDWARKREVPRVSDGGLNGKILFWVGCSGAFHPRYQEVARAMVKILKAGGIDFAILGKEELCCGDPARRLGEESLFLDMAQKNIRRFKEHEAKQIVTLCPHCFNTLKNEYSRLGNETESAFIASPRSESSISFEVIHASEFVMGLIDQRRIFPKYPIPQLATIHDPCYLGRINGVYTPIRKLLMSVPRLRLKELKRNRENGFCCGGGGGRMWLHEHLGQRINQLRAKEISEAEVELVGTACPYCLTMLDDGIKSLEMENPPKVWDIVEIVASSLG